MDIGPIKLPARARPPTELSMSVVLTLQTVIYSVSSVSRLQAPPSNRCTYHPGPGPHSQCYKVAYTRYPTQHLGIEPPPPALPPSPALYTLASSDLA